MFPSPGGVWIAFRRHQKRHRKRMVSVPWRGVDCIVDKHNKLCQWVVSVPWRGVDCIIQLSHNWPT